MSAPDLETAPRGLTSAEAATRLAVEGPNALPVQRKTPAWRLLAAEMVHFFALLFWVAGGLAFLAGMPQLGIAVFVVIVLNGVVRFRAGATGRARRRAAARPAAPPGDCRARRRHASRYLPKTWSPTTSCCWPRAIASPRICGWAGCTRWQSTPRR